jgi:antitoxin CcdA
MPRPNTALPLSRKRPVNLTLSESLVTELKGYTSNLSATAEELLTAYVVEQKQARSSRQQQADQAVAGWNTLHAQVGSFADEHSTL